MIWTVSFDGSAPKVGIGEAAVSDEKTAAGGVRCTDESYEAVAAAFPRVQFHRELPAVPAPGGGGKAACTDFAAQLLELVADAVAEGHLLMFLVDDLLVHSPLDLGTVAALLVRRPPTPGLLKEERSVALRSDFGAGMFSKRFALRWCVWRLVLSI